MNEPEQSQNSQAKEENKQGEENITDLVEPNQTETPEEQEKKFEEKESQSSVEISQSFRDPEKVITVGRANTISISSSPMTPEEKFEDTSKPLPHKPEGLPSFDSEKEIEEFFKRLKNERVILVECFDENILRSATYELVNRAEKYYEKRLLAFEGGELKQTDLHLSILVNEKIGSGEKLIVVISLKSQRFLDSMFVEESLYAQSIKEQLEKNDIMFVCFANSGFLQENVVGEKYSNFHFPKWTIPFLPYLLKAHFKDEAKSIEEQILQQRNYGLWDENNSDREFYGLVYGYLRNGAEQLRKEVEKRKQYEEGQSVQEFLKEIQKVRPKELVQDDQLVKNTVLYVATFFPGLSRRDFDYVVSLLLEGQKTENTVESSLVKTKKGRIIGTECILKKEEKDCLEIWENGQDKLFAECHLQVIRSETGSQIFDFSLPYLRGELKKYLEQKSFYLKHFERFQESGLLFNFNVSRNIINNLINLSVEMAISDPNYYGGNWLMGIIIGLKQHIAIDTEIEADNEFEALIQSIAIELAKKERRQQIRPIIIRLSELIREMLNHPQLQEMIKNFLENLMKIKQYDAVLVIVLGIVKQLRFVSQFNGMYWIRQLLERGDSEAKDQAYQTLLDQARFSGLQTDELLGTVQTWLPDRDLGREKYSVSNKYALKFIMDYAINTVSHFKEVHYGAWPSKYPLFANLEENQDFRQIDLLMSWLFHPGMQDALYALNDPLVKENNISVNILLADLIEMWFKILYGLDTKKVRPKSLLAALDRLLQQIVSNTDRSQQTELMRRWWGRQSFFIEAINKIDVAQRAQRQRLSNERQVILELHKKFKALMT